MRYTQIYISFFSWSYGVVLFEIFTIGKSHIRIYCYVKSMDSVDIYGGIL